MSVEITLNIMQHEQQTKRKANKKINQSKSINRKQEKRDITGMSDLL